MQPQHRPTVGQVSLGQQKDDGGCHMTMHKVQKGVESTGEYVGDYN